MKKFFLAIFIFVKFFFAYSEMLLSNEKHLSFVSSIIPIDENSFLTSDANGFIILHTNEKKLRYQITKDAITSLALSPDKTLLAVSETDNANVNRISVWDFQRMKKKYSKRTNDAIVHISFSSKGTYLILGTASVGGAIFLNANDGKQVRILKNFSSMIASCFTSESEKTLCLYSPAGTLFYFNLQNGMMKQKIAMEANLENVRPFANDRFLLATKNNAVFIVSALNGKTIKQFPSLNAFLLSERNDNSALWLSKNADGNLSLLKSNLIDNAHFSASTTVKNFFANEKITSANKNKTKLFLGSASGNVFSGEILQTNKIEKLALITKNENEKILDFASDGKVAFYLLENGLYNLENDEKIFSNDNFTNCIFANKKIILFSNREKKSVISFNLETSETQTLFTPTFPISTLHASENFLVAVESDKLVRIFNMENGETEIPYSAENITDAILWNEKIFVSCIPTKDAPYPLVIVDAKTGDVSDVQVKGKIMFSLSENENAIFGIHIKDDGKTTSLFSYEPTEKIFTPIFNLNDEDERAFSFFANGKIFANIGKDAIHSYALLEKQHEVLERAFSLPEKILAFGKNILALNSDGTLSWYEGNALTSFWQKKKSGTWEKINFEKPKSENASDEIQNNEKANNEMNNNENVNNKIQETTNAIDEMKN